MCFKLCVFFDAFFCFVLFCGLFFLSVLTELSGEQEETEIPSSFSFFFKILIHVRVKKYRKCSHALGV